MLPKRYRLNSPRDFKEVYRKGRRVSGQYSSVICSVLGSEHPGMRRLARVGFVTSKKVGKAAIRNRARRRMREIFRPIIPQMKDGVCCVVVIRNKAAQASFEEMQREVMRQLRRLQVLEKQ